MGRYEKRGAVGATLRMFASNEVAGLGVTCMDSISCAPGKHVSSCLGNRHECNAKSSESQQNIMHSNKGFTRHVVSSKSMNTVLLGIRSPRAPQRPYGRHKVSHGRLLNTAALGSGATQPRTACLACTAAKECHGGIT